jgi:hypothetical protein
MAKGARDGSRRLSRPWKIVITVLTTAATLVGGLAAWNEVWPETFPWQSLDRTARTLFVSPGGDEVEGDAVCAQTSVASQRREARACIVAERLLYDPCFVVAEGLVDCPAVAPNSSLETHLYHASFAAFHFDEELLDRVTGSDTAMRNGRPWALQLDAAINNETVFCYFVAMDGDVLTPDGAEFRAVFSVDEGGYICQPLSGALLFLALPQGFIDGTEPLMWLATVEGSRWGSTLDQSGDVWRVQLIDITGGTSSEALVEEAWF